MGCFGFKSRVDNRLNIHDPPVAAKPAVKATTSDTKVKGLFAATATITNTRARSRSPMPAARPIHNDGKPNKNAREDRPTGLFADVKPPLLGVSRSHRRTARRNPSTNSGSSSTKTDALDEGEERGRGRGPTTTSPADGKASKLLGRDADPAIRQKMSMASMRKETRPDNFVGPWPAVAPATSTSSSPMVKEATENQQRKATKGTTSTTPKKSTPRTRRPKPAELPGTFADVSEKQVLASSDSSLSHSALTDPPDSAVELPADDASSSSDKHSVLVAELAGSEVSTVPTTSVLADAIELPGSVPVVEADAGPPPPIELPASFKFGAGEEKAEGKRSLERAEPQQHHHQQQQQQQPLALRKAHVADMKMAVQESPVAYQVY